MPTSIPTQACATPPAELALAALWQAVGLPPDALAMASLPGSGQVLPSSFDIATAAQASIGAAGLAAAWLWLHRSGQRQQLLVDRRGCTPISPTTATLHCGCWACPKVM